MTRTILIADDELQLRTTLGDYLRRQGYRVLTAADGAQALSAFHLEHPDLVVLDVMMPPPDGFTVARLLRKESAVPILFLTARDDEADQVAGLEIGADEYVTKPFSLRLVAARVRALLRRAYGDLATEPRRWRVGELELDADARRATLAGRELDLTPNEFGLLQVLMARPDRVFTRLELLDQLQGESYAAYPRTIDVHVKNLRIKIEDDPRDPHYIETVYGVGYRLRSAP